MHQTPRQLQRLRRRREHRQRREGGKSGTGRIVIADGHFRPNQFRNHEIEPLGGGFPPLAGVLLPACDYDVARRPNPWTFTR